MMKSAVGVRHSSLVAGHGGEETDLRCIGEKAFDAAVAVDERILAGMPHGVARVFDQGLCRAPANEEQILRKPLMNEILQLFFAHEAASQGLEGARADAFNIHPDGQVVESNAEAIPGMADVEWLRGELRFSLL